MNHFKKKFTLFLFVLASLKLVATEQENPEDDEQAKSNVIVIKGSKTGATIQESPNSVTVLTEEFIADSRINTISDIDNYIPNLKFSQLGEVGDRYISIRGISSNPLIENRVAVYIDGVPYRTINDQLLVDIAQIEVLRGPQGTLYGANTEGGVIIASTAPIDDETEIRASLISESFDSGIRNSYSLAGSGIINNHWAARLAVTGKQGDAYTINIDPSREEGDFNDKAYLICLFFNPNDRMEFNLQMSGEFNRADGMYEEQYVPMNRDLYNSTFAQPNPTLEAIYGISQINSGAVGSYEYHLDGLREFDEDEQVTSLSVSYELDNFKLVSISSFRDQEQRGVGAEFEFTSYPLINTGGIDERKELYQELRLTSTSDSEWDWVVGLSYLDAERSFNVITKDKIAGATDFVSLPALDQKSTDLSFFAHARIPLPNERFAVSIGARWETAKRSVERKEPGILSIGGQPAAVFPVLAAEKDFTELLPKVALDYAVSDQTRIYISAASGWQPGGFNDDAFVEGVPEDFTRYQPEKIWTYEVGAKGNVEGEDLRWSFAAFHTQANDWQEFNYVLDANGVAQSTGLVTNAAELESQGIEAEINWYATPSLLVVAGVGYTDAEYGSFEFTDTQSFTGNKMLLMPEHTANLVLDYQHSDNWFGRFEATTYGDMYLNPDNSAKQNAYHLLNASVGYRRDDFTIAVFVENISDEFYFNGQAFTDFAFAIPNLFFSAAGQPRTFGIQFGSRW